MGKPGPRKGMPKFTSRKDRFDYYWMPEPNTGCWLWTAATTKEGYGVFEIPGVTRVASRAAWVLYVGKIPAGINVCHKCDNRCCVNPDHLFLGTQADNVRDCIRKGRDANWVTKKKGYASPFTKISKEIVEEIRSMNKLLSQSEVARRLGFSQSAVSRALSGKRGF